ALRPVFHLGHAGRDVPHVGHHRPLEAARRLSAERRDPAVIRAVERVLEADVAKRAVARDVRGIEHADVYPGEVQVLDALGSVPVHLRADRRGSVRASRRKRWAAAFHAGPPGQADRVAATKRTARLDRLDDRRSAAEERVAIAGLRLSRHSVAELLIAL